MLPSLPRSVARKRWTIGSTYVLIIVVDVRSYSLISGSNLAADAEPQPRRPPL